MQRASVLAAADLGVEGARLRASTVLRERDDTVQLWVVLLETAEVHLGQL